MITTKWKSRLLLAALLAGAGAYGVGQAIAQPDDTGMFELDGNAVDEDPGGDPPSALPDDWDTLYDAAVAANPPGQTSFPSFDCSLDPGLPCQIFTFVDDSVVEGGVDHTVYEQGGAKDIKNISDWGFKSGSVGPDKNQIQNAYAAAYVCDQDAEDQDGNNSNMIPCAVGDLILHFGLDRFANAGDANLNFWFFDSPVSLSATPGPGVTGDFVGSHTPSDFVVNMLFPQGGDAEPVVQVLRWDIACTGDGKPDADCVAKNLRLIARSDGDAEVLCEAGSNDFLGQPFCAITNDATEFAPWPYDAKSNAEDPTCTGADPDCFPFDTFFEGAINITELFGLDGVGCVSSFLAATRSTSGGGGGGETAQLKDFALGGFELCNSMVMTEIHAGTDHVTNLDGGQVVAGTTIHDLAIITGTDLAGTPETPTGTVTFNRFNNDDCTGDPASTEDKDLETQGSDQGNGVVEVESGGFTPTSAGFVSYEVEYSGDENYPESVADCEVVQVIRLDSSVSTEIHAGSDHNTDIQQGVGSGEVLATTVIHDQAIITGQAGESTPTGTVTFTLYDNGTCDGTPINGTPTNVNLNTGTVDGGNPHIIRVESSSFDTTGYVTSGNTKPLSWSAKYNGDAVYKPSSDSACEVLTVKKLESKVVTEIHESGIHNVNLDGGTEKIGIEVHDLAIVSEKSDDSGVPDPTGKVEFEVFANSTCGGTATSSPQFDLDDSSENGEASVETGAFTPTILGISFKATYLGDDVYTASTESACEQLIIELFDPKIRTEIHAGVDHNTDVQSGVGTGTVKVGTLIHDFAVVSEEFDTVTAPDPTGNVTFTLYDNGTCSPGAGDADVLRTQAVALADSSENGTADVEWFPPADDLAAGTYSYSATYGGDANYNAANLPADCEVITVEKFDPGLVTHVIIKDKATITGDNNAPAAPIGDITFELYGNATCTGDPISTQDVAIANGMATSTEIIITSDAVRSYKAVYEGDANYNGTMHACEVIDIDLPPNAE